MEGKEGVDLEVEDSAGEGKEEGVEVEEKKEAVMAGKKEVVGTVEGEMEVGN